MAEANPGRPRTRYRRRPQKKKAQDDVIRLCTAYLYRKDGCDRGELCNYLHICRNYMLKHCKAGGSCPFGHDLQTSQPQDLFQRKFGISGLKGEMLQKFKTLFVATLSNLPKDGVTEESKATFEENKRFNENKLMNFLRSFADTEERSSEPDRGMKTSDAPQPTIVKAATKENMATTKVADSKASGAISSSTDKSSEELLAMPSTSRQIPGICPFYIRGSCTMTHENKLLHYAGPFQWQIQDATSQLWLDLTRQANNHVEEHYCDVNNTDYTGGILVCGEKSGEVQMHVVTITFAKDTFTVKDKRGQVVDVRRLATLSFAQAGGWRRQYSTHWTWYLKDNNMKWNEYPKQIPDSSNPSAPLSTTMLEKKYLDFKFKHGTYQRVFATEQGQFQINFSRMEQTFLANNRVCPLARRPKFSKLTRPLCDGQSDIEVIGKVNKLSIYPKQSLVPPKSPDLPSAEHVQEKKVSVTKPGIKASHAVEPKPALHVMVADMPSLMGLKVKESEENPACLPKEPEASVFKFKTPDVVRPKVLNVPYYLQEEPRLREISSGEPEERGFRRHRSEVQPRRSSSSSRTRHPSGNSRAHAGYQAESVYICVYFLRGKCIFSDDKYNHKRHCKEPYQWQTMNILQDIDWLDLPILDNGAVEESFCNVNNSLFSASRNNMYTTQEIKTVHFETSPMTGTESYIHVRRISTQSSVTRSNWEKAFCTEWIWYWLDENGTWMVYSEQNAKGITAGIDSATIEQKYLDFESKCGESEIDFTAGGQKYKLDFTTMQQTNVHYRTRRPVRRRPKFVRMDERRNESRQMSEAEKAGVVVPKTWDKPTSTQTDMKLVTITDCTSPEYINTANLFWDTMDDKASIVSIQRIQNLELWEDFSKMSERMKKRNGGKPVLQKQLFHGTQEKYADAICRQNFDWRLSGTTVGTLYGKGSYFARDAVFAHSYTKADAHNQHYVFISQVLVGTTTTGDSSYTRPPPKDHQSPLGDLYDSCVNDMHDSKIFVIFKTMQVYPEYLIKYKLKSDPLLSRSSSASTYRSTQPTTTTRATWAQPTASNTYASSGATSTHPSYHRAPPTSTYNYSVPRTPNPPSPPKKETCSVQ